MDACLAAQALNRTKKVEKIGLWKMATVSRPCPLLLVDAQLTNTDSKLFTTPLLIKQNSSRRRKKNVIKLHSDDMIDNTRLNISFNQHLGKLLLGTSKVISAAIFWYQTVCSNSVRRWLDERDFHSRSNRWWSDELKLIENQMLIHPLFVSLHSFQGREISPRLP